MQRAHATTAHLKEWYLAANGAAHRVMCAEEGQGLAEYALVLALIAIVAASALLFLSGGVDSVLSKMGAQL